MLRGSRTLAALAGAALMLIIAAWFDTVFLRDAAQQAKANFNLAALGPVFAAGSMLVAGCVLLAGVLAWRAASVVVSLAYAFVGGFFVTLPWIVWTAATATNDAPPVLPEPLLTFVSEIYLWTAGSLNAAGTIGAAMLIAGVAALVRRQRDRAAAANSIETRSAEATPLRP